MRHHQKHPQQRILQEGLLGRDILVSVGGDVMISISKYDINIIVEEL